jgi:hypothetical protein
MGALSALAANATCFLGVGFHMPVNLVTCLSASLVWDPVT